MQTDSPAIAARSSSPGGAARAPSRHRRAARIVRCGGAALIVLGATAFDDVRAAAPASCSAFAAGGPACGVEPIGSVGTDGNRFVANPIDVVTGNKYQHRTDFEAFGSRLAFSRHYNTAQVDADLGLGRGWRHDYDVSLGRVDETNVRIFQSDGRQIDFEAVGVDAALAAGIAADALSTGAVPHLPAGAGDGYLLLGDGAHWHLPDGRDLRFRGRYLVEASWPDGDRLRLRYRRDGRLASVTDRHDRSIRLEYTPGAMPLDSWDPKRDVALAGHLERVVMPNGEALEYRYDGKRNLTRVDHAGEPIERLAYTDRDHPNHLTALDADGEHKRWHYDGEGRGDGYADGRGSALMLEYLPEPVDSSGVQVGRTLVTRRDGAWLDYRWSVDGGGRGAVDAVIEHGCAGCAGVPRPRSETSTRSMDLGADESSIAGLKVLSLGADTATVSVKGLVAPITVRFDRKARPSRMDSSEALADTSALREAVVRLDGTGTVDPAGNAYASRRKANCPPPTFRTCEELERDQQMAILSTCVYEPPPCGGTPLDGWEVVPYGDIGDGSLARDDFVQTTRDGDEAGFHARPYRNTVTGELVVAFRGTEPDWRDIVADYNQYQHGYSDQYKRANLLADRLDDMNVNPVTYTGHSLGGGLATTAAATGGQDSITFNSAALSPATAEKLGIDYSDARRAATNYVVPGEAVTTLQDIPWQPGSSVGRDDDYGGRPRQQSTPAPGQRYEMRPPHPDAFAQHYVSIPDKYKNAPLVGGTLKWLERAGNLHRSQFVLSSMEETINHQCGSATP